MRKNKTLAVAGFFACTLGLAVSCNKGSNPNTYTVEFNSWGDTVELLNPVTEISADKDLTLHFTLSDSAPKQHYYLPKIDDQTQYHSVLQVKTGETDLVYGESFQYEVADDVATLVIPHANYAGNIVINAQAGKVKHTISIVEDPDEYGLTKHYGFNLVNPNPEAVVETTEEYYHTPSNPTYATRIYGNVVYEDLVGPGSGLFGHYAYELPEQVQVMVRNNGQLRQLSPGEYSYKTGFELGLWAEYYYADFSVPSDLVYEDIIIMPNQMDAKVHEIGCVTSTTYEDVGGTLKKSYVAEFHNDSDVEAFGDLYYDKNKGIDGTFNISDYYSGLYKITDLNVYAKVDPEGKSRILLLPSQYTYIASSEQSSIIHIDSSVTMEYWNFEFELIVKKVEGAHKVNVAAQEGEEELWETVQADPVCIINDDSINVDPKAVINMRIIDANYWFLKGDNNIKVEIEVEDETGKIKREELTKGTDYSYEITNSTYQDSQYGTIAFTDRQGQGIEKIAEKGQIYITVNVEPVEPIPLTVSIDDTTNYEIDITEIQKYDFLYVTITAKNEATIDPTKITVKEGGVEWTEEDYNLYVDEEGGSKEAWLSSTAPVTGNIEIITKQS